ncbi:MAG: tetratricopeptide repeat protein [Candidatus Thorarchaeota archaeon]
MNDSVRTYTEEIAHSEQLMNEGKFNEALLLVETIDGRNDLTSFERLKCHLFKSTLMSKMGHYKDALEIAERAKDESQRLEAPLYIVDALVIVSDVLLSLGRFDESLKVVEQGERVLKTISLEQQSELVIREATLLNRRGVNYMRQGYFDRALDCHERSLLLFEEIGNKQGKAESFSGIGSIHWRNGDLDTALQYFEQSLTLREEIGDKFGISSSLNAVGIIYRRKGDLNRALEYYKRSLVLKEEIGNTQHIATVLNNIGVVYRRKGNLERALEYLEESLKLQEEIGNKESIGLSLSNIGLINRDRGDLDSALEYLQRSLQLREEVANNLLTADILFSLITITIDKKELEQARWYLERLVEINNADDYKIIHQYYRVAEALVLKTSSRRRDREKAKLLLNLVIEEEIIGHEMTMIAMVNFYDLTLADLKVSGNQQAFDEARTHVCRLSEVAKEQQSYAFLAETHILKAKLALLELDLLEARKYLTKAQLITDERGLRRLAMIISREHDTLLDEASKWEELIEKGAPLVERAVLVDLQATVADIIRKRVATQSELPEDEPVYVSILQKLDGSTIYSRSFLPAQTDDLSSVIEKTSIVLSSQSLNRARLSEYTLLMQSEEPFNVCYVFKGQSYSAKEKLAQFTGSVSTNDSLSAALKGSKKTLKKSDSTILENLILNIFL